MGTPVKHSLVRRAFFAAVALAVLAPASAAHAASDPLTAATDRVTAAARAQNSAIARYDAAQDQYYALQDEATATEKNVKVLEGDRDKLAAVARARALVAYKGGEPLFDGIFAGAGDVLAFARRATVLDRINARGQDAIAKLTTATNQLHDRETTLHHQLDDAQRALTDMKRQAHDADHALADANNAERSLRAQLAAEKRLRDYNALLTAARAEARAATSTAAERDTSGNTAASSASVADGNGGGAGQIVGHGAWVCPVQGPVSFTDDYGSPRSGGRHHKGNDMFSPGGTPVVAPVAGSVWYQSDPLGGLAAYVNGVDGNTYYEAHLRDYAGGGRPVQAGEVVGHVGNTGDAAGGPTHLHFEIRIGGPNGERIDPYPTISAHC